MNSGKIDDCGSTWKRWDLHVHTPESALANQFSDWDNYINALERAGADVSVIGITDYCSIEGYKKILDYRSKGRLQSFEFILPNIEFRTHPETPEGRAINLHILIDPSDPDHVTQIENALHFLTFEYAGNKYSCTTDSLRSLGKAHDPAQTDAWGAFKNGVNCFKPSFEKVREWLQDQAWLRANCLVVLANSKDGGSGLSRDLGFSAVRDELYRFADLIFSANPNDRSYFLGHGTDSRDNIIRKMGRLKPCIHGSDAHRESKLFLPEKSRMCWIKAKPTFEGLRQVIHEPDDRVMIGPTHPVPVDTSKVIKKIILSSTNGWFQQSEIALNSGLVGIIGEKGSGKTALAELIAFGGFAPINPTASASFVKKARPHVNGLTVKLVWQDGHESSSVIGGENVGAIPEVRYLSQDFVEELCSSDLKGARLVREIEQVVFSHIDEADRLDAPDFDALRRIKTENIARKKVELKENLSTLNREIVELENQLLGRANIENEIDKHRLAVSTISKQIDEFGTTFGEDLLTKLKLENDRINELTSLLAAKNKKAAEIEIAAQRAIDYETRLKREYEELERVLLSIGFTNAEASSYKPNLQDGRDEPFSRLLLAERNKILEIRGVPENLAASDSIYGHRTQLTLLQSQLETDQERKGRLLKLQEQKSQAEASLQRLIKESVRLDKEVSDAIEKKRESRWDAYLSYFSLLESERDTLSALYAPLKKIIADDPSGAKAGFQLDVAVSAAHENWLERGRDLLDKRKAIPLTNKDLVNKLSQVLFLGWHAVEKSKIKDGLASLQSEFGGCTDIDALLVTHADRRRFYDWLFSVEHVTLRYGLLYQGVDLEALSPGTRGIALLVLYLAMDQKDCRPLIIDQPEGNLDNSSVYESLVPFLREAKKQRQVILVTHNPNLVVTTDAEQVLIAKAVKSPDKKTPVLEYVSGGLEDAGPSNDLRTQAIRLLEGGPKPFKMREARYSLRGLQP